MTSIFAASAALLTGLVVLAISAESLVKGAVGLAAKLGISPLVIGLTVVAFGTSAPELSVSVIAAISGNPDLTTGNIVGSNIANIGLILGTGVLMTPLLKDNELVTLELPFLVFSGVTAWIFSFSGTINRIQGLVLFTSFCLYLWVVFAKKGRKQIPEEELDTVRTKDEVNISKMIIYVIAGLVGLIAGSKLLVWGAVVVARYVGISELVIGLTLTALGTSLPELAATVAAARKGHGEIILGNVLGSNLANVCAVLGPTAVIHPINVNSEVIRRDFPIMLLFTLALVLFFFKGKHFGKLTGIVFLSSYLIYIGFLGFF